MTLPARGRNAPGNQRGSRRRHRCVPTRRRSLLTSALVAAGLLTAACAPSDPEAVPGRSADVPRPVEPTATMARPVQPTATWPAPTPERTGAAPTAPARTAPPVPVAGTAAPVPPPALAWYALDHGRLVTWSTHEERDRTGRIVAHTTLSRHVDLADSDWRVVVTTRPAGAAVPTPRGAEPMRLGDRDARVTVGDGRLAAVWTAPGAVVSVAVDAPRATTDDLIDMAAHVRSLSNEEAYWLAPVVSVPGSERVLFDADDAKRFASRLRGELLEAGLRVGEPEPSPDGLFYTGTTREGAEVQLWVGPGVYSPTASAGQQTIADERTVTSRVIAGNGWRFELLLVAPERSWSADTARALVVRLSYLAPALRIGRTA